MFVVASGDGADEPRGVRVAASTGTSTSAGAAWEIAVTRAS